MDARSIRGRLCSLTSAVRPDASAERSGAVRETCVCGGGVGGCIARTCLRDRMSGGFVVFVRLLVRQLRKRSFCSNSSSETRGSIFLEIAASLIYTLFSQSLADVEAAVLRYAVDH